MILQWDHPLQLSIVALSNFSSLRCFWKTLSAPAPARVCTVCEFAYHTLLHFLDRILGDGQCKGFWHIGGPWSTFVVPAIGRSLFLASWWIKLGNKGGNAVLNVVIFWTSKLEKYTPYCIGNFGPTNQNFWLCPGGIEYYVMAFKLITFQWVKKYQTCQSWPCSVENKVHHWTCLYWHIFCTFNQEMDYAFSLLPSFHSG